VKIFVGVKVLASVIAGESAESNNTSVDLAELNRPRAKGQEGWLDEVANGVTMGSPRPPFWYFRNKATDASQLQPDLTHSWHF